MLMTETGLLTGTVLRASSGLYEVDVQALPDESREPRAESREPYFCTLRGRLKNGAPRDRAQPISVGDVVRLRPLETSGGDARGARREGCIEEVLPRRSELGRARAMKSDHVTVANLDQAVIITSLRTPDLNLHRLDRFLVMAEAADVGAVICFNKADLLSIEELKEEVEPWVRLYRDLGYTPIVTSAETGVGIEELRAALRDRISAFIGASGAGKSSLANAVQADLQLATGEVMGIGKGRHTTTGVVLLPLATGGYVVDTPGVKTVSLLERKKVNVPYCFPEFRPLAGDCRFDDCSHRQEPGCAVREAATRGRIHASRYASYLKI
jgi:ribosome biogenesis GTPase